MGQSEAFVCGDRAAAGVAEAALQDVETLRQLILRDLEEDGWSHDSDHTPTNKTANESSSFTDRRRPESLGTVLNFSTNQWESEEEAPPPDTEQPSSIQVVRKGNTFYLVMPTEQGESATDDLTEPARHSPPPLEEVTSPQTQLEEETPICRPEPDQFEAMQLEQEEETRESQTGHQKQEEEMDRWQAGHQSHVIRNVDEIFHTIEGLTKKLRQLKEIETSHQKLLETLREPFSSPQSADVCRTASLDRGSGDGKEGSLSEPRVQSTGF